MHDNRDTSDTSTGAGRDGGPRFVWADLSTFDLSAAVRFYGACFGWRFTPKDDEYTIALAGGRQVAAVFPMPEQFRAIKMPSFWMSYVSVEDIGAVVERAKAHGGRVEVEPSEEPGGGLIALIRDPAGAGFTCYEGNGFGLAEGPASEVRRVWHELHVSDAERVRGFYGALFGWALEPSGSVDRWYWLDKVSGERVGGLQVTANELKGDKEYWGVYFGVESLDGMTRVIERGGGSVIADQPLGDRPARLLADPQGAAFYLVANEATGVDTAHGPGRFPWRAVMGLALVVGAVAFDASWVWGVLFLLWLVPDLRSGSTHFFDLVERRRHPSVYWTIVAVWVALSVYLLVFGW